MVTPSFDGPSSYRSVMPPAGVLNALSALTFAATAVVQFWFWPAISGLVVPSATVAVCTPLLAFVPSGLVVTALRRRETRAWARAHGFTYIRRPGWPVPRLDVAPFSIERARRRHITDGMTGTVGNYPAWHMHYRWLNNNRVQVTTHARNIFALTLPRALPPLTIGPTISPEAGRTVTFESIEFNEKWWVVCPDDRFAKAAVVPQTMDRLLSMDLPVTCNTRIVIAGRELLAISIGGNRGSDITRLYCTLRIIADGLSPYVWDEWAIDRQEPQRS